MIKFVIIFITSFAFVLFLHEITHFATAKVLGLSPKFIISKAGTPIVRYKNNHEYIKIFFVAISAPIIVISVTVILPNISEFILVKILGILNIINLLPITTDGEVAVYAILKLWKRKNY